MHDSGAPRAAESTAAEQHAAWVMVRFAAEVGYRGLHWSIPNDASWRQPFLAAVPVHYDGLLADTYELRSQRRFASSARTVCALIRREGGFEARGAGRVWSSSVPSWKPISPRGERCNRPLPPSRKPRHSWPMCRARYSSVDRRPPVNSCT